MSLGSGFRVPWCNSKTSGTSGRLGYEAQAKVNAIATEKHISFAVGRGGGEYRGYIGNK